MNPFCYLNRGRDSALNKSFKSGLDVFGFFMTQHYTAGRDSNKELCVFQVFYHFFF